MNSVFAERIYSDEPVRLSAPERAARTPPRIRAMRGVGGRFESEAKIFWQQGLFMADFEDDFDFRGTVVQYYPTYRALTDFQLRGYFSWRTRLRRGDVQRTSLSFAFLYAYELLNRIGVPDAETGFRSLRRFWEEYRTIDSRLDAYLPIWLQDYAVYYDLPAEFLAGLPAAELDDATRTLLEYGSRSTEDVFAALNSLSAYAISKSRFFAARPEETKAAAVRVFRMVSEHHNRKDKPGADAPAAREKLFGRLAASGYTMFRSAVFHHRLRQEDRSYALGPFRTFVCERGVWSCERFVGYGRNNRKIGELLRETDCQLRESAGFASSLKPGKVNKTLRAKIAKELAALRAEQRAQEALRIDPSKLAAIREAANKTRQSLLAHEEEEAKKENAEPKREARKAPDAAENAPAREAPRTPAPEPAAAAAPRPPALSPAERTFLLCLLRGDAASARACARGSGLPPSVLADAINEKCFPLFGDAVLAGEADSPEILEDYAAALKGMFPA